MESLEFLCIRSYHLQRDNFTFSFPIWMAFISSSCLIPLARTSSATLNRSGKSRCLCLFPDLRGKTFSLSPLNMIFFFFFWPPLKHMEVLARGIDLELQLRPMPQQWQHQTQAKYETYVRFLTY